MGDSFGSRLRNAWNIFLNRDKTPMNYHELGYSHYRSRPDRIRYAPNVERTIMSAIYTRIGIDAAGFKIVHARLDVENDRYLEPINSTLNDCLSVEANVDQTGRAFIQDVVMSLCSEGSVAIVPVDVSINPKETSSYDILSLRTGKILEWFPRHIRIDVYNDRLGKREELILPKTQVAIIENPLYAVMNETNSTLKRLVHKLALLDVIDNQSGSGKLDLILQLPYVIKTKSRREEAEKRRTDIEKQLTGSKYGIAYTDGTEKITQLNRPVENNLLKQIELLTSMLYGQLGISQEVLNGVADEKQMLNYHNRTLEPIISAIIDEMKRKFLTKTARTQGQTIMFFRDPFKLVPIDNIADIADKFTRNEILSSNEFRAIIGFKPSDDPEADELRNKNINRARDMDEEYYDEEDEFEEDDDINVEDYLN